MLSRIAPDVAVGDPDGYCFARKWRLFRELRSMKQIMLASLILALSFPASANEAACSIPGDPFHWIIDYCMYKMETDDFENPDVQQCLAQEEGRGRDDCEIKSYYKVEICEMSSRYSGKSSDECMADESFSGSTVRNGGVGG